MTTHDRLHVSARTHLPTEQPATRPAPSPPIAPVPVPGLVWPPAGGATRGGTTAGGVLRRKVIIESESLDGDDIQIDGPEDLMDEGLKAPAKLMLSKLIAERDTYQFDSTDSLIEYLTTGRTRGLRIRRADRPDRSPDHHALPAGYGDTRYNYVRDKAPKKRRLDQSPERTAEGAKRPRHELDLTKSMQSEHSSLAAYQGRHRTKIKGKNTFSYTITLPVRLVKLNPGKGGWEYTNETWERTFSVQSQVYQSRGAELTPGRIPAMRRLTDEDEIGAKVREGIKEAHSTAIGYRQFEATSVRANEKTGSRKGKHDYGTVTETNDDDEYLIPTKSLGSCMFHSETQARGMAQTELRPLLQQLIEQIVDHALALKFPVEATILGMHVVGVSHPNTVCTNACKPALTSLLDYAAAELVRLYHPQKDGLSKKDVYLRRGAEYKAFMDVHGEKKFGKPGTGAVISATSDPAPEHGRVSEFSPEAFQ